MLAVASLRLTVKVSQYACFARAIKMMSKNILLTGSNGFLGSRVKSVLNTYSNIRLATPSHRLIEMSPLPETATPSYSNNTHWATSLFGQQIIIHTAAQTQVISGSAFDHSVDYERVNVNGTLNLANQAALAGVKRFIFVSSIKVNGESTKDGAPYTADDIPAPEDDYSVSKFEAEKGLFGIAAETGLEVVIIRPPMVYGPGAQGNFYNLKKIVETGVPLPLASIKNCRSMVAVDNLVDLIITCIDHPRAANEVFLVSDGQDFSTPEIIRELSVAIGRSSRLFPFPPIMIKAFAMCVGKRREANKLLGSLQVDIEKTKKLLGWKPPFSVRDQLKNSCQHSI